MVAMGDEDMQQMTVVQWLERHGWNFMHPANGVRLGNKNNGREMVRMKLLGFTPGASDLLIFDSPPAQPDFKGVAIEMKTPKGKETEIQTHWRLRLEESGWLTTCCYGQDDAIRFLTDCGYDRRKGAGRIYI